MPDSYFDGDPGFEADDEPAFTVEDAKPKRPRPEPRDPNDKRPVIRLAAGELDRVATEAEDAVVQFGPPVFQRGPDLVRPITREVSASRGRLTVSAALQAVSLPGLIDMYCSTARWERFDARCADWVRTNPPSQVAAIHLSRVGQWTHPVIAGVITTPTMRPDGSILSAPGYDPATRLFHVADPTLTFPRVADRPTRQDASQALDLLSGLLVGFPFVVEADRSVGLAALLTPIVRGAMQAAPLFAIRATTAGTGKSYLADLVAALSTARPCPVISAGSNEEETEKRLAGLLLEGFPLISIDNVNGELGGDLLCQAVERPLLRLRRLGASDIIEIEGRQTILATGNGLRVRGDMVRRTLLCTLDAGLERPELRSFDFDPVEQVLADRGRYVAAAITIVRAFRVSGSPTAPPLASFQDWSDTVRSALIWLGCADPCDTMEKAREDDPELEELREVLTLWSRDLGTDAVTGRDLADKADERQEAFGSGGGDYIRPDLRDVLVRAAGERGNISTRKLGYWLRSREGRIVEGKRLVKSGEGHGHVTRWAVKSAKERS